MGIDYPISGIDTSYSDIGKYLGLKLLIPMVRWRKSLVIDIRVLSISGKIFFLKSSFILLENTHLLKSNLRPYVSLQMPYRWAMIINYWHFEIWYWILEKVEEWLRGGGGGRFGAAGKTRIFWSQVPLHPTRRAEMTYIYCILLLFHVTTVTLNI